MKRVSVASLLLVGATLLFSSCATIVSRSKYEVTINSAPSQAEVRVVDRKGVEVAVGQTPLTVRLKAKDGFFKAAHYSVLFRKEGYNDVIVPLKAEFDPWYVGNLFSWGVVGLVVDAATGAMWRIDDDVINVSLVPQPQSQPQPQPQPVASIKDRTTGKEMAVYALADVPEAWHSAMIKVK